MPHILPAGTLNFSEDSGVQDGKVYRELQMGVIGGFSERKKAKKLQISEEKHEIVVSGFEGNLMLRCFYPLSSQPILKACVQGGVCKMQGRLDVCN